MWTALIGQALEISTHSLTRRLTAAMPDKETLIGISTHSLTRRLTTVGVTEGTGGTFQLTASRGG